MSGANTVLMLQKFSAFDIAENGKEFDVVIDLGLGELHRLRICLFHDTNLSYLL